MNKVCFVSAATLAIASGAAQAAFLSFASDMADQAYTFTGNAGAMSSATNAGNPLQLVIDDNNGPAPRLEVSVAFSAQYTLTFVGDVALPGGAFSHNYAANGSFSFTDIASGVTLLTTTFSNALFTARGAANTWFSTGALQVDSEGGSSVNMVWGGANLPAYGLSPGVLTGTPRGFAFDLSAINFNGSLPYNNLNPGVALNTGSKLPAQTWWSESSFSASVNNTVPAPAGAAALAGLGGLFLTRRRRA